ELIGRRVVDHQCLHPSCVKRSQDTQEHCPWWPGDLGVDRDLLRDRQRGSTSVDLRVAPRADEGVGRKRLNRIAELYVDAAAVQKLLTGGRISLLRDMAQDEGVAWPQSSR